MDLWQLPKIKWHRLLIAGMKPIDGSFDDILQFIHTQLPITNAETKFITDNSFEQEQLSKLGYPCDIFNYETITETILNPNTVLLVFLYNIFTSNPDTVLKLLDLPVKIITFCGFPPEGNTLKQIDKIVIPSNMPILERRIWHKYVSPIISFDELNTKNTIAIDLRKNTIINFIPWSIFQCCYDYLGWLFNSNISSNLSFSDGFTASTSKSI